MAWPQLLSEDGDAFEKREASWLRQHLPGYEKAWQCAIGNDGNDNPLLIPGLSDETQKRRRIFYQAHYSLGLTAFLLDRVTQKIQKSAGDHYGVEAYLRDIEDFTLFIAYVGQIVDMVRDIGAERTLAHQAIYAPFDRFYGLRSHALHAARIPLQLDKEGLKIPAISYREKQSGEWNDDALWEEADPKKFVQMARFCTEVRDQLFEILRSATWLIAEKAIDRFGQVAKPTGTKTLTSHSAGSHFSVYHGPAATSDTTQHARLLPPSVSGKRDLT
jgi:hypothetical protein